MVFTKWIDPDQTAYELFAPHHDTASATRIANRIKILSRRN